MIAMAARFWSRSNVITGERINGAEPAFDGQESNQPIVRVSTDGQGARVLRGHGPKYRQPYGDRAD